MSEEPAEYRPDQGREDRGAGGEWEGGRGVRRLRRHLGETQAAFADRLGTNQQTVSEWERGARSPRRMARRLLHLVAEQAGYYDASDTGDPDDEEEEDAAPARGGGSP